jgi:hypothetical protein
MGAERRVIDEQVRSEFPGEPLDADLKMDDVNERAVLGGSYPSEGATAAGDKAHRLECRTGYGLELSVEFAQPMSA